MEKKKKSIVIGLTSLLLVTLLLLGLTYAYYKTKIVGNSNEKSVSVTSKKLEVTYQNESAVINAEGIEPGYTATKTFEVKNTGSETVEYSVMLDNVTNTFTRLEDWTYTISVGGTKLKEGTLPKSDSYILYSESIDAGETKNYTLVINYVYLEDVDQSDDMGASLSFRINISNGLGTTLTSASEGTLLYAINRDNVVSEPLTIPGQQASTSNEAVLASTEDDYGTSYYYRGAVENNYVNYSGMCWRIVRVQGDGTIKLTLADKDGECDADSYSVKNTTSAFLSGEENCIFGGDSGTVNDFIFNASLLSGFDNNLDTSKLANAEWCNDTAKTSVSDDVSYYGAYDRLHNVSTANPTLKCNTKGMDGTTGIEAKAQKYKNILGILSADEVVFAGSTFGVDGLTYLQTNATGLVYWTLSPNDIDFTRDYDKAYIFTVSGSGLGTRFTLSTAAVRPAVVLNSNVTISSGNGTQTNPYVIS